MVPLAMSLMANAPIPPFGDTRASKYSVVNSGGVGGESDTLEENEEDGDVEIDSMKEIREDIVGVGSVILTLLPAIPWS